MQLLTPDGVLDNLVLVAIADNPCDTDKVLA